MATTGTKFTVGLFLILGTILAVTMVIWVGMSSSLRGGEHFALYFDESVQGLDKDSHVKYRGVAIGRVDEIQVAPDGELIEVIITVGKTMKFKNLVAQLKGVGITGIMFIELNQIPKGGAVKPLHLTFSSPYPVIPSKPSDIQQIFRELESVFERISTIDFKGISDGVKNDLDVIDQAVADANIKEISSRFVAALNKANTILEPDKWLRILETVNKTGEDIDQRVIQSKGVIQNIDHVVERMEKILAQNQKTLHLAIEDLRLTLHESSALVSSTDIRLAELHRHLLASSQNLEKATENLNTLLETLSQDPGQAILGEPPPARTVAPDTRRNKE